MGTLDRLRRVQTNVAQPAVLLGLEMLLFVLGLFVFVTIAVALTRADVEDPFDVFIGVIAIAILIYFFRLFIFICFEHVVWHTEDNTVKSCCGEPGQNGGLWRFLLSSLGNCSCHVSEMLITFVGTLKFR